MIPTIFFFGDGKKKDADKDKEFEQIEVQFKARETDKYIHCNDIHFDHFPTAEEIAEEYGGGIWLVTAKNHRGRIIKRKKYVIRDQDIRYPVKVWRVKVKMPEGRRFYKVDGLEYDSMPTPDEIKEDIGGGGIIRLEGYDAENRRITYKQFTIDEEPPKWLLEAEDTIEKKMKEALNARIKQEQEKLIQKLTGEGEEVRPTTKKLSETVNEIINAFEELQLERFEQIVDKLTSPRKSEEEQQPKKTLTDVLFVEPQKIKLEAMNTVIRELAKSNPMEAAKMIEKMPDATGALMNLINAGSQALMAFANVLQAQSAEKMAKLKQDTTPQQQQPKQPESQQEQKDVLEAAEETAGKVREQEKSQVGIEVTENEKGWEVEFKDESLGGIEVE